MSCIQNHLSCLLAYHTPQNALPCLHSYSYQQHLYTAITRAKNNVIIFDESAAKRAPFYHLLRSLGMARVVTT